MWKLSVRSTSKEPHEYVLRNGRYILGRHSENDIVIDDESASRQHAELICQEDNIQIRDLDSLNGTFVNRERLTEPLALSSGDQIRIGFYVIRIFSSTDLLNKSPDNNVDLSDTQPLTRDLLIESVDKSSILLHEFTSHITTILDLDLVLEEISKFLRTAIAADKCRTILADQYDKIDQLELSKSIAEQAISKKSVIILPDTYHIESISDSAHNYLIRTALCVPIMLNQEVVGIIYATKSDADNAPFDQNDAQLAMAVSHQAALAIQRSQFLERAKGFEQLALTDSLTGLNNRRKFIQDANTEIARARRFEHPMSLMIIDIDDFKIINDTYGHLVGDQVLVEVANRLKVNLRNIDLLARYGGDEFIIILVEADKDYAASIAERLYQTITNTPIETTKGKIDIAISIGISAFKQLKAGEINPLQIADDALYSAKSAGKNQIKIFDQ